MQTPLEAPRVGGDGAWGEYGGGRKGDLLSLIKVVWCLLSVFFFSLLFLNLKIKRERESVWWWWWWGVVETHHPITA